MAATSQFAMAVAKHGGLSMRTPLKLLASQYCECIWPGCAYEAKFHFSTNRKNCQGVQKMRYSPYHHVHLLGIHWSQQLDSADGSIAVFVEHADYILPMLSGQARARNAATSPLEEVEDSGSCDLQAPSPRGWRVREQLLEGQRRRSAQLDPL